MKRYNIHRIIIFTFVIIIILFPFAGLINLRTNAQSNLGSWQIFNTINSGLPSDYVRAITIDNDGSKWFGVGFEGAAMYDGSSWTIYNTSNSGIPNNIVNFIAIDPDGSKWISTDGYVGHFDGINWTVYNQSNSSIPDNEVGRITIDLDGSKWFSTWGGGVVHFDGTSWIVYNPSNSGLPSPYVGDIEVDVNGTKWFATVGGAASFDGSAWDTYTSTNSGLPIDWVTFINITSDGSIWFSTNGSGIVRYDGSTWITYDTTNSGIHDNHVYELTQDNVGSLWFTTLSGIVKYDGITWKVFNTSNSCLPYNAVRPVVIDTTGNIWFGTLGGGVAVLLDENGSDCNAPISTPTPTPIPTPSPTPTPTPTPTPIPTTKVVIVPGFAGSINMDALRKCDLNDYEGEWGAWPGSFVVYGRLLIDLYTAGYTPLPFYYDWRKPVTDSAPLLSEFILTKTLPNERVHLVGHSMGGLVGRAYLEEAMETHKIDKLLTVGSPHQGVVDAYPAWSAGEIPNDIFWRSVTAIMKRYCGNKWPTMKEIVQNEIPSVQNFLPVFDYLKEASTGQYKPVSTMVAQNNWLPNELFTPPFFQATVGSLVGSGFNTLEAITVRGRTRRDALRGDWEDGRPIHKEFTKEGDKLVLSMSSTIDGAQNTEIDQNHAGLVMSGEGIGEILSFLDPGLSPLSIVQPEAAIEEPKSALLILGHPARFWLVDPNGKTVKDENGLLFLVNPQKGDYKLSFFPLGLSAEITVIQLLGDGRTLEKDYRFPYFIPRFKSLRFDPLKPLDNPLR
jgi:pimeloyl-ACP methyl ester carboxylesterase/streptogramin lyase